MRSRLLWIILPACVLASSFGSARAAVTEADFQMRTAQDLVDLCSAAQNDPLATPAVNFCHGFAIGVYQALSSEQAAMRRKLFCLPDPPPTRNQALADFVSWARTTPSALAERPADAILHFLTQRYPCASR